MRVLWIVALMLAVSGAAFAGDFEPFPDAWFFSGADRPKPLRALEGKDAKPFVAKEWRGDETSLDKLKGKVVVLDFWATWCGPCMAAIPKNVALVDKYKADGLVFIGMHDSNSGWDRVDKVIADKQINYPVALDDGGKSTKAYNLQFWPTYVLIDRNGIVRAAGMAPNHVEAAVKVLLAEPYAGAPTQTAADDQGFDADYYFGGEMRPGWLKAAEGKPLAAFELDEWIGEAVAPADWDRRVLVLQFIRSDFAPSLEQLDGLAPLVEQFERQGVVFAAIADPRSDWDALAEAARERRWTVPIGRDVPIEGKPMGMLGAALGVRFMPPLAVVDRAGVVRGVGLRPDRLESVINELLAERLPAAAPAEAAAGNVRGSIE